MSVYDPKTRPMYVESPPDKLPQQLVVQPSYPMMAPQVIQYPQRRSFVVPIIIAFVALGVVLAFGTGQVRLFQEDATASVPTIVPTMTAAPTIAVPTQVPNTKPKDPPKEISAPLAVIVTPIADIPGSEKHLIQSPGESYYTVGDSPVRYYTDAAGAVDNVVLPGGDPTAPKEATGAPPEQKIFLDAQNPTDAAYLATIPTAVPNPNAGGPRSRGRP